MSDETYDAAATSQPAARDIGGRHPVNVGHLVMGLAFLGLTGLWVLFEAAIIGSGDLRWFIPIPWLLAGIVGLLAVVLTGRRRGPDGTTPD